MGSISRFKHGVVDAGNSRANPTTRQAKDGGPVRHVA
jgi:hypothetical protein